VTGKAVPVRDFNVLEVGQSVPLVEAPHRAANLATAAAQDDAETEWVVPVAWVKTVPREQAISFKGRYGNQNSATRLTHALTRETVLEKLGVTDDVLDAAAGADSTALA
jgi:hypothetical protein